LLRGLNRFVQPAVLQLLTFFQSETLHNFRHPIGRAEIAHEIVFEADIEPRSARIPLARATSAKLSIYTPRFVTFCSKDKQSAKLRNTGSKFNIGTASGHVRRNCHRAGLSCSHDN